MPSETPGPVQAPAPTTVGSPVDATPLRQVGFETQNMDTEGFPVSTVGRYPEYAALTDEGALERTKRALLDDPQGLYRPQERQLEQSDRLMALTQRLREVRGEVTAEERAQVAERARLAAPLPIITLPAIPAGEFWDVAMIGSARQVAREHGVPDHVVPTVYAHIASTYEQDPVPLAAAERQLRQAWGHQYEAKLEAARLAYQKVPLPHQKWLRDNGYENDPRLCQLFAEIGAPLRAGRVELDVLGERPKDNPATADELLAAARRAVGKRT